MKYVKHYKISANVPTVAFRSNRAQYTVCRRMDSERSSSRTLYIPHVISILWGNITVKFSKYRFFLLAYIRTF